MSLLNGDFPSVDLAPVWVLHSFHEKLHLKFHHHYHLKIVLEVLNMKFKFYEFA